MKKTQQLLCRIAALERSLTGVRARSESEGRNAAALEARGLEALKRSGDPRGLEGGRIGAFLDSCYFLYAAALRGCDRARAKLREALGLYALRSPNTGEAAHALFEKGPQNTSDLLRLTQMYETLITSAGTANSLSRLGAVAVMIPDEALFVIGLHLCEGRERGIQRPSGQPAPEELLSEFSAGTYGMDCENSAAALIAQFGEYLVTSADNDFAIGFGMPAEAAYRIAMEYLRGGDLPRSVRRASVWLHYAMAAGSPRAWLAFAVFFEELVHVPEEERQKRSGALYAEALEHAVLLCQAARLPSGAASVHQSHLVLTVRTQEGEEMLEPALLLSLMAVTDVMATRQAGFDLSEAFPYLIEIARATAAAFGPGPDIAASLCRLLSIAGTGDWEKETERLTLEIFPMKKNPAPGLLGLEILKPYLGKKRQGVDLTLLSLGSGILDDPEVYKACKALSERGYARASFSLASAQWAKQGAEGFDQRLWALCADQGHPVASYNCCVHDIGKGRLDEAEKRAFYALRSRIPQAFFMLYEIFTQKGETELGCTCLRYACEYLMKPALDEAARLKKARLWRPLPFIRDLEKIEERAKKDPVAAGFLGSLYCSGLIVPCDRGRAMEWFRLGAARGEPLSGRHLSASYGQMWDEEPGSFYVMPVGEGIASTSRYGLNGRSIPDPQQAERTAGLVKKLYADLRSGKTWLERELMVQCENSPQWDRTLFNVDDQDEEEEDEESAPAAAYSFYPCADDYLDKICNDQWDDYAFGSEYADDDDLQASLSWRQTDLEYVLPKAGDPQYGMILAEIRALTALRGVSGPDLKAFEKFAFQGFNADSALCEMLISTDLRALEDSGDEEQGALSQAVLPVSSDLDQ